MLSFPPAVRIWLAPEPVDFRCGFDTLAQHLLRLDDERAQSQKDDR